jgi:hypothetical protein
MQPNPTCQRILKGVLQEMSNCYCHPGRAGEFSLSGLSFSHHIPSEAQLGLLRADIPSVSEKGYGRLIFFSAE